MAASKRPSSPSGRFNREALRNRATSPTRAPPHKSRARSSSPRSPRTPEFAFSFETKLELPKTDHITTIYAHLANEAQANTLKLVQLQREALRLWPNHFTRPALLHACVATGIDSQPNTLLNESQFVSLLRFVFFFCEKQIEMNAIASRADECKRIDADTWSRAALQMGIGIGREEAENVFDRFFMRCHGEQLVMLDTFTAWVAQKAGLSGGLQVEEVDAMAQKKESQRRSPRSPTGTGPRVARETGKFKLTEEERRARSSEALKQALQRAFREH